MKDKESRVLGTGHSLTSTGQYLVDSGDAFQARFGNHVSHVEEWLLEYLTHCLVQADSTKVNVESGVKSSAETRRSVEKARKNLVFCNECFAQSGG